MGTRRLLKSPTMGGKVFWTDVASTDGWRVQHNKLLEKTRALKPYRLLDPEDNLCASADSLEEMTIALPNLAKDFSAKSPLFTKKDVADALAYLGTLLVTAATKGKVSRKR